MQFVTQRLTGELPITNRRYGRLKSALRLWPSAAKNATFGLERLFEFTRDLTTPEQRIVLIQPAVGDLVAGTDSLHLAPEPRRVVHLAQVH
jgi:hypothetical protein